MANGEPMEGLGGLKSLLGGMGKQMSGAASLELERMAEDYAEDARAAVPVGETGELAASIRVVRDSPTQVVVIAGETDVVPYAAHVEYGTSRMDAQPFMRPAAAEAESNLEDRMGGVLKKITGTT